MLELPMFQETETGQPPPNKKQRIIDMDLEDAREDSDMNLQSGGNGVGVESGSGNGNEEHFQLYKTVGDHTTGGERSDGKEADDDDVVEIIATNNGDLHNGNEQNHLNTNNGLKGSYGSTPMRAISNFSSGSGTRNLPFGDGGEGGGLEIGGLGEELGREHNPQFQQPLSRSQFQSSAAPIHPLQATALLNGNGGAEDDDDDIIEVSSPGGSAFLPPSTQGRRGTTGSQPFASMSIFGGASSGMNWGQTGRSFPSDSGSGSRKGQGQELHGLDARSIPSHPQSSTSSTSSQHPNYKALQLQNQEMMQYVLRAQRLNDLAMGGAAAISSPSSSSPGPSSSSRPVITNLRTEDRSPSSSSTAPGIGRAATGRTTPSINIPVTTHPFSSINSPALPADPNSSSPSASAAASSSIPRPTSTSNLAAYSLAEQQRRLGAARSVSMNDVRTVGGISTPGGSGAGAWGLNQPPQQQRFGAMANNGQSYLQPNYRPSMLAHWNSAGVVPSPLGLNRPRMKDKGKGKAAGGGAISDTSRSSSKRGRTSSGAGIGKDAKRIRYGDEVIDLTAASTPTSSRGSSPDRKYKEARRDALNGEDHAAAAGGGGDGVGGDETDSDIQSDSSLEITGATPAAVQQITNADPSFTPVCIGVLTSMVLILYPTSHLKQSGESFPVVLRREIADDPGTPTGYKEMIKVHLRSPDGMAPRPLVLHPSVDPFFTGRNEPPPGDPFGVVEQRAASVLGGMMVEPGRGLGAGVGGDNGHLMRRIWIKAEVVKKGEGTNHMLPLQLLLFTLPPSINLIAESLAANHLFLQHPPNYYPQLHANCGYHNPHAPPQVHDPEADRRRRMLLDAIHGTGSFAGPSASSGRPPQGKTIDLQREQVDQVFKSLKSGPDLDEVEPDLAVSTPLYSHQKQALSFLLDRERLYGEPQLIASKHSSAGHSGASKSADDGNVVALWRKAFDRYGRHVGWTSVITEKLVYNNNGNYAPPQSRGAILADDMGLGKTIVVISLVCTTMSIARQWAAYPPTKDGQLPTLDSSKTSLSDFKTKFSGPTTSPFSSKGNKKPSQAQIKKQKQLEEQHAKRFSKLLIRSHATLVVCPLSTVQNWESQFGEHTRKADGTSQKKQKTDPVKGMDTPGSSSDVESSGASQGALSIYVYHGPGRMSDPLKLSQFDVVITTFSTVGTEFSKQTRHSSNDDDDGSESSDGFEELNQDGQPLTKPGRPAKGAEKKSSKRKKPTGPYTSPLQAVEWFRVVLDEAHIIKEHTTIQARAACDLMADRRICLTGTPLQNNLNDLYSLVRFLRLEPLIDRAVWTEFIGALAKNNDPLGVSRLQLIMRHLALRRTKETVDANGKCILSLPPKKDELRELIFDEREKAYYTSKHVRYKSNFRKLQETDSVLKNYCSILQELLRLRQICVHMDLVSDSEDAAAGEKDDLVECIKRDGITRSRAIQLLTLMRDSTAGQCAECNYDMLSSVAGDVKEECPEEAKGKAAGKKKRGRKPKTEEFDLSDIRIVITRCQHLFCLMCWIRNVCPDWSKGVGADHRASCSVCKEVLTPCLDAIEFPVAELEGCFSDAGDGGLVATEKRKKGKRSNMGAAGLSMSMSTKIKALLGDLIPFSQANPASANFSPVPPPGSEDLFVPSDAPMFQQGQEVHPDLFRPRIGVPVKSVVFSQWTKLLDKIEEAFDAVGIKYGRLDGGMQRNARNDAMDMFKSDPSCEVLLVSLRAGGVGLNLTAAQRVYLMEPFWNPAVENQAVDRIHRLGQTKPVKTVRFIIKDSIEANMLKIQKRKTDLANMSLGQTLSKEQLAQRRKEELGILLE